MFFSSASARHIFAALTACRAIDLLWIGALLLVFTPARAQQPAASAWSRVQALPAGTEVRVSSNSRHAKACTFASASETALLCTVTHSVLFVPFTQHLSFARTEVVRVRLSRRLMSGLAGAGMGAAAGAGIGAGVETQYPSQEDGPLTTVLFAFLGGALGGGIGASTDFLSGPTIYQAP